MIKISHLLIKVSTNNEKTYQRRMIYFEGLSDKTAFDKSNFDLCFGNWNIAAVDVNCKTSFVNFVSVNIS